MEVHKLNAALNWDGKYGASPWDLQYADIDLAMRCYPTDFLQIPIKYVCVYNGHHQHLSYCDDLCQQMFNLFLLFFVFFML